MKPFIDITGASGSVYRFKGISGPGRLPATAGNFVFTRTGPTGDEVICCGKASSLVLAEPAWRSAVEQHQTTEIYVRLNVSHGVRDGEHDDIVAHQKPILVIADRG